MTYNWLKWFHGTVTDDKWPMIARRSRQPVAVVIAVWAALLECASQDEDRGSVEDFDAESMDAVLQVEDGVCAAIVDALSTGKRPRIIEGRIANWDKRQQREDPKDPTGRDRKRRQRDKERQGRDAVKCPEDCHDVTRDTVTCHSEVTLSRTDKIREDKIREKTLFTHESLVNQDPARALNVAEDDPGEFAPAPALLEEPDIEFVELREFWDRECKSEGPLSGWQEYKALKAARQWPGMGRIAQDVAERYASGAWEKGWAKALGNYLRERYWQAEAKAGPQKQARASPRAPTVYQQGIADKDAMARVLLAEQGIHMPEAENHDKHNITKAYDVEHRTCNPAHAATTGLAGR